MLVAIARTWSRENGEVGHAGYSVVSVERAMGHMMTACANVDKYVYIYIYVCANYICEYETLWKSFLQKFSTPFTMPEICYQLSLVVQAFHCMNSGGAWWCTI